VTRKIEPVRNSRPRELVLLPRVRLASCCLFSCLALAAVPSRAQVNVTFPAYGQDPSGRAQTVQVRLANESGGARRFTLTTSADQRDNAPKLRSIVEAQRALAVHSSSLLFDALFAQAIDDARLDSVSSIADAAYNAGQPILCECFQTGEKWTYVWTRDLSYSAYLSLAVLDPIRVRNSLLFKVSSFRSGLMPPELPAGTLQLVQDTGSGGSWPVSSDRTSWALGAEAALNTLQESARTRFAVEAYRALRGSVEADRAAIFDAGDGLYTGEQSFLDWREQTYAPYVVKDLTQLAQSKALSTNTLQYRALRLVSDLARERGETALASRYGRWADALKIAVNRRFWMADYGLYASLLTPDAPAIPVAKFDLLGEALAVMSGIADSARARDIVAHYPHAPFGPPVYYPEQPGIAIYHNRANWPFVTAFDLEAAAQVGNVAVADNAFDSMVRAAALHLTNTENLEWLTGRSQYGDGPVINSPRQLWSVAGYIDMVAKVIFGYHLEKGGLRIQPFLTAHMRAALGGDTATLANLAYKGRALTIELHLPPQEGAGYYPPAQITLNGRAVTGAITPSELKPENKIVVNFRPATPGDDRILRAADVAPDSRDDPRVFAPQVPSINVVATDEHAILSIDAVTSAPQALRYAIWRDGVLKVQNLNARTWLDPEPLTPERRHCYRVVASYAVSGNASHPSAANCIEGTATTTIGWPGTDRTALSFKVKSAGMYALSLTYDNHAYDINTGVTNAVKRIELMNRQGRVVAAGVVQMPHIEPEGAVHPYRRSTELRFLLPAGDYVLKATDYFNMSYLQTNAGYAHAGGQSGPLNDALVKELQITRMP
jgi:glycogen debranching enzyme